MPKGPGSYTGAPKGGKKTMKTHIKTGRKGGKK
jgi:hypothetical protein